MPSSDTGKSDSSMSVSRECTAMTIAMKCRLGHSRLVSDHAEALRRITSDKGKKQTEHWKNSSDCGEKKPWLHTPTFCQCPTGDWEGQPQGRLHSCYIEWRSEALLPWSFSAFVYSDYEWGQEVTCIMYILPRGSVGCLLWVWKHSSARNNAKNILAEKT
jgi:hypothetical protein